MSDKRDYSSQETVTAPTLTTVKPVNIILAVLFLFARKENTEGWWVVILLN